MLMLQVRGMGGSGKTTTIRRFISKLGQDNWEKCYVSWKRKPAYLRHKSGVVVLGHYDGKIANGCDTLGLVPNVFKLLKEISPKFVVCEGLFLSEDKKFTIEFSDSHQVKIVYLDTSMETSLTQITQRNIEVGNDNPINQKRTRARGVTIAASQAKLVTAGISCVKLSVEKAIKFLVLELKQAGVKL